MSEIERYLRKPEKIENKEQVYGIDQIYLINLDQRPERLQEMREQLAPFSIFPSRLSAIHGWRLALSDLQQIGLQYRPGMDNGADKVYKPCLRPLELREIPLDETCYGKACFHPRFTPGAIGCALSHLSVIHDALSNGFKTIWILEDDARVVKNPHLLSHTIEKLDELTGKQWDALYTDDRAHFEAFTPGTVWRPDLPDLCYEPLYEYSPFGNEFMRIGGRCQAHSVILRESGMRKIYDFETKRGLFMPYDVEISFASDMLLYNLKDEIVWGGFGASRISDTDFDNFRYAETT